MEKQMIVCTEDGGKLNMRSKPGTNGSRIAQIPNGDTVTVVEDLGDWSKVEWGGKTGYVMSRFLTEDEPGGDMISVPRDILEAVYDMIGSLLKGE